MWEWNKYNTYFPSCSYQYKSTWMWKVPVTSTRVLSWLVFVLIINRGDIFTRILQTFEDTHSKGRSLNPAASPHSTTLVKSLIYWLNCMLYCFSHVGTTGGCTVKMYVLTMCLCRELLLVSGMKFYYSKGEVGFRPYFREWAACNRSNYQWTKLK